MSENQQQNKGIICNVIRTEDVDKDMKGRTRNVFVLELPEAQRIVVPKY